MKSLKYISVSKNAPRLSKPQYMKTDTRPKSAKQKVRKIDSFKGKSTGFRIESRLKKELDKYQKQINNRPKMIRSYKPDPRQLYIMDSGVQICTVVYTINLINFVIYSGQKTPNGRV